MAKTYEPIATNTLTSIASDVTFSSIPGTYTDLVLVVNATNTGGNTDLFLRVNGDTGTNYSYTFITGNGSTYAGSRFLNTANVRMGYYGITQSTFEYVSITHLLNYSNTTTYKSWLTRSNAATQGTDIVSAMWRNISAITSLTVRTGSNSFGIGSNFTLFGIKAA